jgi:hypothetical protein
VLSLNVRSNRGWLGFSRRFYGWITAPKEDYLHSVTDAYFKNGKDQSYMTSSRYDDLNQLLLMEVLDSL